MDISDFDLVRHVLDEYFEGLYQADCEKLRSICSPDLILKSVDLRRSLDEWLQLVASRPVPKDLGEPFDFKILSLDLVGKQAMAKLYCPLLGHPYIDFIGLLKENQQWKIVNKMYCE